MVCRWQNFNNKNHSVELVLLHPSFTRNWHKFTWIVIIKIFNQIHFAQQIWSCLVKIVVVWLWLASAFFSRRFYRPLVDIFECKVISVTVSDTVIVLERIKFWNFGLSRLDFMAMFTSNILSVTDSLANIHQKKRAKLPLTCV